MADGTACGESLDRMNVAIRNKGVSPRSNVAICLLVQYVLLLPNIFFRLVMAISLFRRCTGCLSVHVDGEFNQSIHGRILVGKTWPWAVEIARASLLPAPYIWRRG